MNKIIRYLMTCMVSLMFISINKVNASSAHSRTFPNRGLSLSERTSISQFECLRNKGFKDYIVISAFENNAVNPYFFENYQNAVQAGFKVIDLGFSICPTIANSTIYLNNIMKNFFYNIPIYNNSTLFRQSNELKSAYQQVQFDMYLRKNIIVKFDSASNNCKQWLSQSYEQNCRFFNDTVNMLQLTYLQDFGVQTDIKEWIHLFGNSEACNSQEEQYPINYYPLIWTGDQSGNPNFNTTLFQEFIGQIMPQLKIYKVGQDCAANFEFISF